MSSSPGASWPRACARAAAGTPSAKAEALFRWGDWAYRKERYQQAADVLQSLLVELPDERRARDARLAAAWSLLRARTTLDPQRPGRTTRLLTSGVFARSRNPIYLGDALLLAALAVGLGNALNFLLLPLFVAIIDRLQIAAEERALQRLFGDEYRAYCARVRRWL